MQERENTWLHNGSVKSIVTDYDGESKEVFKHIKFFHIIKPENMAGMVHDILLQNELVYMAKKDTLGQRFV